MDHQRRAGEMAWTFGSPERFGAGVEEFSHPATGLGEDGIVNRFDCGPHLGWVSARCEFGSVCGQPTRHERSVAVCG